MPGDDFLYRFGHWPPARSVSVKQESYEARASGMELPRRRAPLRGLRIAESAENEVERRIADAEPFLLTDEMMAKMVLLHPPAHAGSRLIGNVRDIMHPFVVKDRQHDAEHHRGDGLHTQHERDKGRRQ